MAIELQCENGHTLRVKDDAVGKRVRCPKCQTVVLVEDNEDEADFDPPAKPSRKTMASSKKTAKTKGGGKKKAGPGLMLWLALGGGGVAVLLMGIVLFFALRPRTSETVSTAGNNPTSPDAVQPASAPPVSPPAAAENSKPASPTPLRMKPLLQSAAEKAAEKKEVPRSPATDTKDSDQAAAEPASAEPAAISENGLHVWDADNSPSDSSTGTSFTNRGKKWLPIAQNESEAHEFQGDCVVENEKLWLHIAKDPATPIRIAARDGNGPEVVVPIEIRGEDSVAAESRRISVTELTDETVQVSIGRNGNGPSVMCRVPLGKFWVEFIPQTGAETLEMGVNAPYVAIPTEFGEDVICDATAEAGRTTIPLPHENCVIALQDAGNTLSLLTYPSPRQAGEITIQASGQAVSAQPGIGRGNLLQAANKAGATRAVVSRVSALFAGQSVFAAVLPRKDQWFAEQVGKKYTASGQYMINWKPPTAGVWRINGRIQRHYYVTDVVPEYFVFSCSQSGTLDCLFGYQNRTLEADADDPVTPLTVYRETVGQAAGAAYLLETEFGASIYQHQTKNRDVCNSIDEIKTIWSSNPDAVRMDASPVKALLNDVHTIMVRMDQRLRDLEGLMDHVLEESKKLSSDAGKSESAHAAYEAALRRCQSMYKSVRMVRLDQAEKLANEIEQKIQKPGKARLNVPELDRLVERIRDVANHQEDQMKKLRHITLQMAEACTGERDQSAEPLPPDIIALGHHCRRVLRMRDTEE